VYVPAHRVAYSHGVLPCSTAMAIFAVTRDRGFFSVHDKPRIHSGVFFALQDGFSAQAMLILGL
jgi:hypothetical protein